MRHQKKGHRLGRSRPHRKATLAALSTALIRHKRITTTTAKAKALRPFIEPLISRAKDDTTHNRRQVFRRLQDKYAVTTLFDEIAEQVGDRPGGYTRIVKLGRRSGDAAEMAMIELVDYNDVQPEDASSGRKRTRRGAGKGRRRRRKSEAAPPAEKVEAPVPAAAAVEEPEEAEEATAEPEVVEAEEVVAEAEDEATAPEAEAAEEEAAPEAEAAAADEASAEAEDTEEAEDEEKKA